MASSALDDVLPLVDLAPLLACIAEGRELDAAALAEAKKAAAGLHEFGLLLVRDPRASEAENDAFLDMLEAYFEQPEETKMLDVRADVFYQVRRAAAVARGRARRGEL